MTQNDKSKRIVTIEADIVARSGVEFQCLRITPKYACIAILAVGWINCAISLWYKLAAIISATDILWIILTCIQCITLIFATYIVCKNGTKIHKRRFKNIWVYTAFLIVFRIAANYCYPDALNNNWLIDVIYIIILHYETRNI